MAAYNEELTKDFFTELTPENAICEVEFILFESELLEPVSLLIH